ncbi:MAG: DUF4411 family protein [Pseudohongiellaceae bacterium]
MTIKRPYILDADVLITAKKSYYAFAICPGFWDSLIHYYASEDLHSIDQVRNELLNGDENDEIIEWMKREKLPEEFFASTSDDEVTSAYSEVMQWVQHNSQYTDQAKAYFSKGADGWLIAYAMVHGGTVATNERPSPESKHNIKIPDVCGQFNVAYENTFFMLKEIGALYEWSKPS